MGDREAVVAQAQVCEGARCASAWCESRGFSGGCDPVGASVTENNTRVSGRDASVISVVEVSPVPGEKAFTGTSNIRTEAASRSPPERKQLTATVDGNENLPSFCSGALDSSLKASVTDSTYCPPLENGNVVEINNGASTDEPPDHGPALSAEEDRLWSIIRANSLDFTAWTSLIEETEKMAEDNILRIRRVYDAFLAEFPLCYGYWKKYADHEGRLGTIGGVVDVYERAVHGVTYSVDIWLHYCTFTINSYGDPETVRRLFDRGLAYVGTDYLSYSLWDKYIEYEYSQQECSRLSTIYTRIIEHPNQQLDRYLNSFKDLVASRPLADLVSETHSSSSPSPSVPVGSSDETEEAEKYVAIREEVYKKAKELDSKIIGFETAIRRPYFHVRPLNFIELENWHNYLDFIERDGDFNKVVKLYERCLIACANYPEYWIRYVLCMESSGSMDLANNALARATRVFVKRQPDIHLFAAHFWEIHGDAGAARAAYHLVHTEISPGLLEAIVKHANMESRVGKMEDAYSTYEQAIAVEKGKEHSLSLPMLLVQYSRFLYLVCGNAEKARDVLIDATDKVQLSKPLLEGLIHMETLLPHRPKRIDQLDSLVNRFVMSDASSGGASAAEKEEVSCVFIEFLDLFGDAKAVKSAEDRHTRMFLRHKSTSELRKRYADEYMAAASSDRAKMVKLSSANQSLMGAYPASSVQGQWPAAGYSQAWPQAAAAGQQQTQAAAAAAHMWNAAAGYTQQQAYGGSYGTAAYSANQAVSSAQQTAYLSYPQQQQQQQHLYPPQYVVQQPQPHQSVSAAQQSYYAGYY